MSLETGAKVETMEEHCLVAFSTWLFQLSLFYSLGMASPTVACTFLYY